MTRIRVDTELMRTEAARLHTTQTMLLQVEEALARIAASMPSYDGQLSGPSRAAGMEAQSRVRSLANRHDALSQQLHTLAAGFESVDQGPIDLWNQFIAWVTNEISDLENFLAPHSVLPTPAAMPEFQPAAVAPIVSISGMPTFSTPTPTVALSDAPHDYVIQPGDTLSAIASRCGIPVAVLMRANPQITDPNRIAAGDAIVIPSQTSILNPTPHPPRYPGIGDAIFFSGLPFPIEILPVGFQGFGMTLFALAPANQQLWYSHVSGMHNGIDLMVPYDTPLVWRGNSDALVIGINNLASYRAGPNNLILESENFIFIFGHTSAHKPIIKNGDMIKPGQPFGFTGNPAGQEGAGNDHLHFEVRPKGTGEVINPLGLFSGDLYKN
jgi:hypothetical protein